MIKGVPWGMHRDEVIESLQGRVIIESGYRPPKLGKHPVRHSLRAQICTPHHIFHTPRRAYLLPPKITNTHHDLLKYQTHRKHPKVHPYHIVQVLGGEQAPGAASEISLLLSPLRLTPETPPLHPAREA